MRAFAVRALQLRGYSALEADCGEAALEFLNDPELHIDLFLSDVIMPGIDGPTWVKSAMRDRPAIKVFSCQDMRKRRLGAREQV
jgi:two-component system cell cycle sensor histidine kinase/response regulator CckA